MSIDQKFLNLFIKATEKAAIGASRFIGKKDKIAADKAAVDSMRSELNKIDMKGKIVIGEGELFGEVSSLFNKGHSVSAEAATECRLLIIEKDLFYNKVQNADPILKAVIRTLTGRLDDMNEKSEKIWKELHFLSSIKQELED